MAEKKGSTAKQGFSLDWLIGGVLSRLGDTFDRVTGRNWNPSSNLATSKLEEKLKLLLDAEVREGEHGGRFVPHIFKLKIQWNKFSTESDDEIRKLEHELHAAAIDHINDRLYHTYAPIEVSVERDYFVEGVRFIAGFGKYGESDDDEVEVDVTLKNIPVAGTDADAVHGSSEPAGQENEAPEIEMCFDFVLQGKPQRRCVTVGDKRRFSVGRAGTNDIVIDDPTISKVHASVAFDTGGRLLVADTGSTNGTFKGGSRMPYGKATELESGAKVRFGDVETTVSIVSEQKVPEETAEVRHQAGSAPPPEDPAPTVASIDVGQVSRETGDTENGEV